MRKSENAQILRKYFKKEALNRVCSDKANHSPWLIIQKFLDYLEVVVDERMRSDPKVSSFITATLQFTKRPLSSSLRGNKKKMKQNVWTQPSLLFTVLYKIKAGVERAKTKDVYEGSAASYVQRFPYTYPGGSTNVLPHYQKLSSALRSETLQFVFFASTDTEGTSTDTL